MSRIFLKLGAAGLVSCLVSSLAYAMLPDVQNVAYQRGAAELQLSDGGDARAAMDDEQKASGAPAAVFNGQLPAPVARKDQWGHYRTAGNSNVLLNEYTLWQFMPHDTQNKLRRIYGPEWLNNASQCLDQYGNPACKELLENLKRDVDQMGANQAKVKACQAAYLKELIKQLPSVPLWTVLNQANRGLLETDNTEHELGKNSENLCRNNDPGYCQFLVEYLMPGQEKERNSVENRDRLETGYVLALLKEKNKAVDANATHIKKVRDNRWPNWLLMSGYIVITGIFTWPIINAGICSRK